jgi:hypothetical protein
VLYYFNVSFQERLDLNLDFGSDKVAADAESLPSQDGDFVDRDVDMDDDSDEEPAVLPGKGKKPAKESARSSITAARAVPAQKGNRKTVLPEPDSDLEIIDVQAQGKRKAVDIGRMRQVDVARIFDQHNHVMM